MDYWPPEKLTEHSMSRILIKVPLLGMIDKLIDSPHGWFQSLGWFIPHKPPQKVTPFKLFTMIQNPQVNQDMHIMHNIIGVKRLPPRRWRQKQELSLDNYKLFIIQIACNFTYLNYDNSIINILYTTSDISM